MPGFTKAVSVDPRPRVFRQGTFKSSEPEVNAKDEAILLLLNTGLCDEDRLYTAAGPRKPAYIPVSQLEKLTKQSFSMSLQRSDLTVMIT